MNKLYYVGWLCAFTGALAFGVSLFQHIQHASTNLIPLLVDAGIICLGVNIAHIYKNRKIVNEF